MLKTSPKEVEFMENSDLRQRSKDLAIRIFAIWDNIDTKRGCGVLVNQIIRSSTSIGANLHEAKYAKSTADFINKMEIALKECYETEYWLEILFKVHAIDESVYKNLNNKCGTIRRKLIASIKTAKGT